MAVTLSLGELAVAVRITTRTSEPVPEPYAGILTRQLAVATAHVERRAPDAPSDVQNEAVIRIVGWLVDQPASGNRSVMSAWNYSGASGLLSPWVEPRAVVVE